MATWAEFEAAAPEVASGGRELLTQFGIGLAFLSTVRPDGGPRLHPICVILADGGLFAFLVPSPKSSDLARDGRFALHAFAPEKVDDEFAVTGRATLVDDAGRRGKVAAEYRSPEGKLIPVADHDRLFELGIESALLARYRFRGDWPPTYTRWRQGWDAPRVTPGAGAADAAR
jgi:hypothetical protein